MKEKSGMSTEIFVERMLEDAVLPKYAHDGDAGMDLYSVTDTVIRPGETVLIHTGLKFAIPYGYEVQIRPRSGLSIQNRMRECRYHAAWSAHRAGPGTHPVDTSHHRP